jgi:hypothetical protein
MKNLLIACAILLGFLALPVIYSTAKGYTVWFWRNPHAQILVNGQRVAGYVHHSKHVMIVTRGDLAARRSYWVDVTRPTALPNDCGAWSAPDFFVFAVGDINMPCLGLLGVETTSETPGAPDWNGPHTSSSTKIEFRTTDGKTIRVVI